MIGNFKATVWRILAGLYFASGIVHFRHRGRVVILTYHRVVSDDMVQEEHIQPGMYVRAQSFQMQLDYLSKQFDIISLDELLELWRNKQLKSDRAYCVITFDDGWKDNYQFAFPVLMRYRVPATIFLATDYIGTSQWFWPDHMMLVLETGRQQTTALADRQAVSSILTEAIGVTLSADGIYRRVGSKQPLTHDAVIELCKQVEVESVKQIIQRLSRALHMNLPSERVLLNWDEVREMSGQGVTFGSHSCSHRLMTQIPLSEVKQELIDSRERMLQQGIKPVPVFCYPNGNFNREIQQVVRESGYVAAVETQVGLEGNSPGDLFALKRIGLHEDSSGCRPRLALAISGFR